MSLHVHELGGCTPEPLAHYLKALGILRLIAEQRDPGARGFWKNERFVLVTTLDREQLTAFFADDYAPTPILAPWNGGSGFYPKDNREGIDPLRRSSAPRFARYRDAIERAERLVGGRAKRPEKEEKSALLRACAHTLGDDAYAWLSAAVALDQAGNGQYPALLGSGGNDGRLDFTNNFMQRLIETIDVASGKARFEMVALLELSLLGGTHRGLVDRAIGQFLPGAAGGANGTAGFESAASMNPWDFILMLEGSLLLRVASLRRLDGSDLAQAAAPFALRNTTEGYGSAAPSDASARGEQWLPLWGKAASLSEVAMLFAEAKLAAGRSRAESALEAARAVARLGAARGIDSFRRFSFMERNGQANLAVPLGSLPVVDCPEVRLLDELDGWLGHFRRVRGEHAPASLARDLRAIEAAAFACANPHATEASWQRLVMALGEAEHGMVQRPKATVSLRLQPLPRLSAGWIRAVGSADVEVRLAIAIASARAPRVSASTDLGPLRVNCAPVHVTSFGSTFVTSGEELAHHPDVVWSGRSLVDDLAACSLRRSVRARETGYSVFPLDGTVPANLDDVAAFLEGRVDDERIAKLARGLMSADFEGARAPARRAGRSVPGSLATYALFRTAYFSAPPWSTGVEAGQSRAAGPKALRELVAGRLADAARDATARLVACGLRPKIQLVAGGAPMARRIAAALVIPISHQARHDLCELVSSPFHNEKEESQ